MDSFDLVVLGCGGGPVETNLSSFLIKAPSYTWPQGCLSLDAGSSLGAIASVLASHPKSFHDFNFHTTDPVWNAGVVIDSISSYCLTHAHLDHISGLVISTQVACRTKPIYASPSTLQVLSRVFDGALWPHLADWPEGSPTSYQYRPVHFDEEEPFEACPGIKARAFPLSHGRNPDGSIYESTAFLLSTPVHDLLVFGDVEPDSLAGKPFNRNVWHMAASRIKQGRLSTIIIECSFPNSRPADQLYGHLNPDYLFEELFVLASFLGPNDENPSLRGRLQGLTVCITHVKDNVYTPEMDSAECHHVAELSEQKGHDQHRPKPDQEKELENKVDQPASSLSYNSHAKTASVSTSSSSHQTNTNTNTDNDNDNDNDLNPSTEATSACTTSDDQQQSSSTSPSNLICSSTNLSESFAATLPVSSSTLKQSSGSALPPRPMDIIRDELHELESRHGLGVNFVILEQGMRLSV